MLRSRKYAFVPFCLLAQGVRATGIVKHHSAVVTPIVELLMEKKINVIQMMCPELIFDGFHREPCGRSKYDTPQNHKIYREVAEKTGWLMKLLVQNGHSVAVVMGIDFSPSCAVNRLSRRHPGIHHGDKGIYIEELQKCMKENSIEAPFVGIQIYQMNNTLRELKKIL